MREDLARVSSRLRESKEEDVENCARVLSMLSSFIYHEGLRRWRETDISVRSDGSSLEFSRFPAKSSSDRMETKSFSDCPR